MIFIIKQLEIYTMLRPYKNGFYDFCFVLFRSKTALCPGLSAPVANLHSWIWWVVKGRRCFCCRNAHQHGSLCQRKFVILEIAPCKGNRIPESGKFLLVESGILGFGIRNPTNDWNPESKFYWQRLESSTWNPESMTWYPESKSVLGSLELVLERSSIFSFPHSPLPCACGCGPKIPRPGFYFRTRARPSQKRISEVPWTGYRN